MVGIGVLLYWVLVKWRVVSGYGLLGQLPPSDGCNWGLGSGSLGSQGPREASRTRALAPGKQIDRGEQKGHSQNLYNLWNKFLTGRIEDDEYSRKVHSPLKSCTCEIFHRNSTKKFVHWVHDWRQGLTDWELHFGENCTFWKITGFRSFLLSPIIHIPKSHSASLNFRILILTQVFTLNSHLSHASYNFIAISFGKTFANDNIIWIIDKIYYGFWPALSIAMKKLEQTDQHVNEEHEIAKVDVDNLFKRARRQFWERIVDH